MSLFRVTVKQKKVSGGICLEPGMSVDVVTNSTGNPLSINGGQAVNDTFIRIYSIDLKKLGALNMIYLDVQRIS